MQRLQDDNEPSLLPQEEPWGVARDQTSDQAAESVAGGPRYGGVPATDTTAANAHGGGWTSVADG